MLTLIRHIVLILVITCLSGCLENQELNHGILNGIERLEIKFVTDEDYSILNSTFIHLFIPSPEGEIREFGYDNFVIEIDSSLEEFVYDVYLSNHLASLNDTVCYSNSHIIISKDYLRNLKDPVYYELGLKLIADSSEVKFMDTDQIINVGFSRIIPWNYPQNTKEEVLRPLVKFSHIVYNKSKDRACFYYENKCGGLCGNGLYIFMKREDDIWVIDDELLVWIS